MFSKIPLPLGHRPAVFSCTPAASWRRRPPPVSAKRSWSASGPLVASPEPPFTSLLLVQHRPTSLATRGLIPGRLYPAREGDQRLPTDRQTHHAGLTERTRAQQHIVSFSPSCVPSCGSSGRGPATSRTLCLPGLFSSSRSPLSSHTLVPVLRPAGPTHSSPSQPTLNRGTGLFRLVRGPATTCDTPAPYPRPTPRLCPQGLCHYTFAFPSPPATLSSLPFPSVPHTGRRRARDPTTVFR